MNDQLGGMASSGRYLETFYNRAEVKRFAFPGALLWGVGARREVADILDGASAIDVYVDAHFADHELTDELLAPLTDRIRRRVAVAGEPRTQRVIEDASGWAAPDAVIAIGGGSTIDFAKAVTAWRLFGRIDGVGMGPLRGSAPLAGASRPAFVAVPTTAGTGADASRYYVTYDADTKAKLHGKSWRLIADWSVLDPAFLRECPDALLTTSAFDAFVHLFESMVCRQEQSWFGQMLSLDAIPRLVGALDAATRLGDRSDDNLLQLLYGASVGGMAISNVRTGNIHEAAGALLEMTTLAHPETLFVFLESAYQQYAAATVPACDLLLGRLRIAAPQLAIASMADLMAWWTDRFHAAGSLDRIRSQVAALAPIRAEVRERVFDRVWSDRVWVDKESPVELSEADVREFVDRGLAANGLGDG